MTAWQPRRGEPAVAPDVQGLALFEQYEADGSLLLVTSDATDLRLEPGDFIVKRPWATASPAEEVNRARTTEARRDR